MSVLVARRQPQYDAVLSDIGLTLDDIVEMEAQRVAFGPFWRKRYLDRAPERIREQLRRAERSAILGVQQGFEGPEGNMAFPGASLRAAINTTTTETNLWDPGIFAPVPAGTARVGKTYNLNFGGVAGTTATPAISFRARWGTNNSAPPTGTDLGVGPTMTCGTFTAQPWFGFGCFGVRILGVAASGSTVTGNGFVVLPGAAAATTTPICVFGGIVATVDTVSAQGLGVSVIWGTSNASNTITPQWMTFDSDG